MAFSLNCTIILSFILGQKRLVLHVTVASEAYHDWSGEAAGARLRVNFTLNYC